MVKTRIILLAVLVTGSLLAVVALTGCRSAHTTAAILYIDEQNYQKAVDVIHEGFQYVDNEPDAYYYLGDAYSRMAEDAVAKDDYFEAKKDYELAYDAYMRTLEIDRKDWEEEVTQALKYNYTQRLRQAKRDWDEKFYEQAEGHLRLAYAALPDSLTPIKSIARMKMQIAKEPDYADQKTELLDEALDLLDQVLTTKPDAYLLRFDKANVLAALGRNDEARAIFDDLIKEHGDDPSLLIDAATLAINEGDFERAADFYIKVVNLHEANTDPGDDLQNKDMLVNAGKWYAMQDIHRYDDAISALERAAELEMTPTRDTITTRLRTYYSYGRYLKDQAAAETDPVRQAELREKAKAQFQRAVEVGNAMTSLFTADKNGFFYLGAAQSELGDTQAAEQNFKTYQELDSAGGTQ